MLRIALADDHAVVRAGYRRLIELESDMTIVAEFADADATYAGLYALDGAVDVLVLDLAMPGRSGLDLLRRTTLRWPALRVLVFSMHDAPALVRQALAAGAAGYISKSSEPALLVDALRCVARGQQTLSPDVAAATAGVACDGAPHLRLGGRELDVLRLLLDGCPLHEIARRLHLSPKTVANHQSAIRAKLGVSSAVELLRYARRHGLLVD